ncbi:hypothetical protein AG1IA_02989 [Rhizoctonia solani AG-1 IA]|uniref:Uncharacterized protein n=1 Tax=Thanatephorus cucumeris (strain AG1-IA) TaxID=983506 RepID=L8X1K1_THACA|nr:hypothetical protein AG1IA_02989 [Rhizoctonia solani AG-1 IA]
MPHARVDFVLKPVGGLAYQICTWRGVMFMRRAISALSSVVGNIVREYVSFKSLSCAALARRRFGFVSDNSSGLCDTLVVS